MTHASDKTPTRELWAIADFAEAHGVSRRSVYRLIERGELEAVSIGRRTLITELSRREWLESLRRFQSGSPRISGAQAAAA